MKGELSMELLGFQMGNMGHHTFMTWSRTKKAQAALAAAVPLDNTLSGEETMEKNLMLTALSL